MDVLKIRLLWGTSRIIFLFVLLCASGSAQAAEIPRARIELVPAAAREAAAEDVSSSPASTSDEEVDLLSKLEKYPQSAQRYVPRAEQLRQGCMQGLQKLFHTNWRGSGAGSAEFHRFLREAEAAIVAEDANSASTALEKAGAYKPPQIPEIQWLRASLVLAEFYLAKEQLDQAIEIMERVRTQATLRNTYAFQMCCVHLYNTYSSRGQGRQTESLSRDLVAALAQAGDFESARYGQAYTMLALALLMREKHDEAQAACDTAIDNYNAQTHAGNLVYYPLALRIQAAIREHDDDLEAAACLYQQVADESLKLNWRREWTASSLVHECVAFELRTGAWSAAESMMRANLDKLACELGEDSEPYRAALTKYVSFIVNNRFNCADQAPLTLSQGYGPQREGPKCLISWQGHDLQFARECLERLQGLELQEPAAQEAHLCSIAASMAAILLWEGEAEEAKQAIGSCFDYIEDKGWEGSSWHVDMLYLRGCIEYSLGETKTAELTFYSAADWCEWNFLQMEQAGSSEISPASVRILRDKQRRLWRALADLADEEFQHYKEQGEQARSEAISSAPSVSDSGGSAQTEVSAVDLTSAWRPPGESSLHSSEEDFFSLLRSGLLKSRMGRMPQGCRDLEKALTLRDEHVSEAAWLGAALQLAQIRQSLGQLSEEQRILEMALETASQRESWEYRECCRLLLKNLAWQGNLVGAEGIARIHLDACREAGVANAQEYGLGCGLLGRTLMVLGRAEEARPWLEQYVKIYEADPHPAARNQYLWATFELAQIAIAGGDLELVGVMCMTAFDDIEQLDWKEADWCRRTADGLVERYLGAGDWNGAALLIARVREKGLHDFGEGSNEYAKLLIDLASAVIGARDEAVGEKMEWSVSSVALRRQKLPPSIVAREDADLLLAVQLCEEALRCLENPGAYDALDKLASVHNLALAYLYMGRYEEARESLAISFAMEEGAPPEHQFFYVLSYFDLACIDYAAGDLQQAERDLVKAATRMQEVRFMVDRALRVDPDRIVVMLIKLQAALYRSLADLYQELESSEGKSSLSAVQPADLPARPMLAASLLRRIPPATRMPA